MPFKSEKQRRFLEMIAHNPKSAHKKVEDVESIKKFVAESEKMPQPKKERFSKLKNKLKKAEY